MILYGPKKKASKYMMQKLAELQGNLDIYMVEDYNTIISVIDSFKQKKINKDFEYSNIKMNMYGTKYPKIREYTLFSSTHGILTKQSHIRPQSFNKY